MMLDDPIQEKRAARWDALVAQGMSPQKATAQVMTELPDTSPANPYTEDKGPQGTEYFKGLGRQFAQGATFEWGDEIEAGLRTGSLSSPEYRTLRDRIREQNERFSKTNPKATLAANIAGGVAVPGLGGAGTVAKVAGRPLAKAAVGAALGGVAGGLTGAGTADEVEDIPMNAGVGTVVGGVVGGVVAPIAGLLGRGIMDSRPVSAVTDKVGEMAQKAGSAIENATASSAPARRLLGQQAGKAGRAVNSTVNYDERMKRRALGLIQSRLQASKMKEDPEALIQEANDKFGLNLTVADLTGNLSGLARTAANRVGEARDRIPEFFEERADLTRVDAPQRIPVITKRPDAARTADDVKGQLRTEAWDASRPNYTDAYTDGAIIPSQQLVRTLESPTVARAYKAMADAELMMRDAGKQRRPITFDLYDEQGRLKKNPSVADLDGLKQYLDDTVEELKDKAKRLGFNGLDADEKGLLEGYDALRKTIISEGEGALPKSVTMHDGTEASKWALARAKHGELQRPLEAYEEGLNFFRMSDDQWRQFSERAKSNPEAYERAVDGILKSISDVAGNPSAVGIQSPLRAALSPVRNQRLKQFLPADVYEQVARYGQLLKTQSKTAGDVLRNSTTARQLIDDATATSESALIDGVTKAARATTGGTAAKVQVAGDFLRGLDAGINPATARNLADYLTRSGPQAVDLLKLLNDQMQQRLSARGAGNTVLGSAAARPFGGNR